MKIVKKILNHLSFKAKILLLFYGLIAIPTIILMYFLYQNLVVSVQNNHLTSTAEDFFQQSSAIEDNMEEAVSFAQTIGVNKNLNSFFNNNFSDASELILGYYRSIDPLLSWVASLGANTISDIRFYTENNTLFQNRYIFPLDKHIREDPCLADAVQELESNLFSIQYYDFDRQFFNSIPVPGNNISIYIQLSSLQSKQTYMEVVCNLEGLYQNLRLNYTNSLPAEIYALRDNSIVFSSDPNPNENLLPYLKEAIQSEKGAETLTLEGKQYYIVYAYTAIPDIYWISCFNMEEILAPVFSTKYWFFLIGAACIGLFCILTNYFVNKLLQRLNVLDKSLQEIQNGNFDISIDIQGNDIIDKTFQSFNLMSQYIQKLIHDVYESKLRTKDLQLKILSHQISPHFLYNTLECLKMEAELNDQHKISEGLTALGKLLRYYANITEEISTVQKELDSIQNYVCLMNLIHRPVCRLTIQSDPRISQYQMPNFVLQPLVENAIKHGGSHRNEITVQIHIWQEASRLHFTISDNGQGIPPEKLLSIQQRLQNKENVSQSKDSIGLSNVQERICLICGDTGGLSIQNNEQGGAVLSFSIAANLS